MFVSHHIEKKTVFSLGLHSVSPNIVMKSPIGLIFCRNMLMDSLQGQLKIVWVR